MSMGEKVDLCGDLSFDGNRVLESVRYSEGRLPQHRDIRVADAVGASALVPGVFTPLAISELYPGMTVRLVDGGVYDNYGLQTLYHDSCDLIIVSDGSAKLQG
jgi:predicted acylesterase/phospholipase RssA